jgi:SM-20-related protein
LSDELDRALGQLAAEGFAVVEGLFSPPLIEALKTEAEQLVMQPAGIGREAHHLHDNTLRQTRIAWLDGGSEAQRQFLDRAQALRVSLNRRFFLGLFEFEAQFGITDPGGFYKRHLDSFAGSRNRLVSLVTYLNTRWIHADGGELLIWRNAKDHGPPCATVWPEAGVSVLMLSEDIPHEVRPAAATRYAIAGWWRLNRPDPWH